MAAPKRNRAYEFRDKIKTTQLVNFLQAVAMTGKDTGGHEITNLIRVQAAKILLDKTVSNAPTAIQAAIDGKIEITHKLA